MTKIIPGFFYGTAWKEQDTERFTYQALNLGLRGIDTANQRKHYYEAGVGNALSRAYHDGFITRDDVYLQSKYTFARGQDDRLPFDPKASIAEQVASSFASSCEHLQTDYLDSFLLHGPETYSNLTANDIGAWRAIEGLANRGVVMAIGVSNFSLIQLQQLLLSAKIRPTFVQNRCYPSIGWDAPIRNFCADHGIIYQGFNLLTDPVLNRAPVTHALCEKYKISLGRLIYGFASQLGILPITGARDPLHLKENLAGRSDLLSSEELRAMESLLLAV